MPVTLVLTRGATNAAWEALGAAQVKGRVEARKHKKVVVALRAGAMKEDPPKSEIYRYEGGKVELEQEHFEYLVDLVDECFGRKNPNGKDGIPGTMGEHFGDLVEAIEALEKPEEKK